MLRRHRYALRAPHVLTSASGHFFQRCDAWPPAIEGPDAVYQLWLPKSASTFCWQLTVDIAQAAGHDQAALSKAFLPPRTRYRLRSFVGAGFYSRSRRRAPQRISFWSSRRIALLSADIQFLIDQGLVRASCTFRDPRDAAVAVHDGAPVDRVVNAHTELCDVRSMAEAIDLIADNLPLAYSWLADHVFSRCPLTSSLLTR